MSDIRSILAKFDEKTITVYQAYSKMIADEAVILGTFGDHFKMDRMTWIKPSFLWMMYRSGWATKDGQERILAIDIKREGFEKIIESAVLSSFEENLYKSYEDWKSSVKISEVRCQWDPDRDIHGNPLNERAIQLGLKGNMVKDYVNNWIVKIEDITENVNKMSRSIKSARFEDTMLPHEQKYPLNNNLKKILGIEGKE